MYVPFGDILRSLEYVLQTAMCHLIQYNLHCIGTAERNDLLPTGV